MVIEIKIKFQEKFEILFKNKKHKWIFNKKFEKYLKLRYNYKYIKKFLEKYDKYETLLANSGIKLLEQKILKI